MYLVMKKDKIEVQKPNIVIWKHIPGYSNYCINNLGEVVNLETFQKRVAVDVKGNGYLRVILYGKNKSRKAAVHRLVAEAFIVNSENKPQVNHLNSNPSCNWLTNLEWCTQSENMKHAYCYGNYTPPTHWLGKKGKENPSSKMIRAIYDDGSTEYFDSLREGALKLNMHHANIIYSAKNNKRLKKYKVKFEYLN